MLFRSVKEQLGLQVGDTIALDTPEQVPLSFTVSGFTGNTSIIMKKDAFGIYMDTSSYRQMIAEDDKDNKDNQDDKGVYYVEFSSYSNINALIKDIKEQLNLSDQQVQENIMLIGLLGQSNDSYLMFLYLVAGILGVLVVTSGVLMVSSSLNSNLAQRTQFFGLLRCQGATCKQITRYVRIEALNWCKRSIPLGIIIAILVTWILCGMLRLLSPAYFSQLPIFAVSGIGIVSGVIVGLVTVLLASHSPAKRAARVSPLTAVSGNVDAIQFAQKAARTSIFKVETALGVHHAKSSIKNFILMVCSFAFSIILFLSFTATIDFMNHAVNPLQPYTPDVSIVSADNTCTISPEILQKLSENNAVERVYGRMFAYDVPVMVNGTSKVINLISYEDHQFTWAEKDLIEGSLSAVQNGSGVCIVYDELNLLQLGSSFTVDFGSGVEELSVTGVLAHSPFSNVTGSGIETVICSEELFRRLTGEKGYTIIDMQQERGATDQDVAAIRNMADDNTTFSDRRMHNAEVKGAYYSFSIFIYGFLTIIALITIFNIINSIAMSVSARSREYGVMRAIGMSDKQVVKMIVAETITYILCGVIIGSVVGIRLHKFIYESMVTRRWGTEWNMPYLALGIIVLIVMLSAIFAVRGPANKIKEMSLTGAIEAE